MSADVDRSAGGLRASLRATLDWARERCGNGALGEVERLEAEKLALDVEATMILYLGELAGNPGVVLEGGRGWREAAERLKQGVALEERLREARSVY